MPEITFVPYLEGQPYSAESLNSRFSTVEAGLEDLSPSLQFGAEGLGSPHLPSLAGYVVNPGAPQTPFLIQRNGTNYTSGPPINYDANVIPLTHNLTTNPSTLNPYTWTGTDFPGVVNGSNLEANSDSWKVLQAGAGGNAELAVGFYTSSGGVTWYPLYLDQPTSLVANGRVWAQGAMVLANFQFKSITRHDDDAVDTIRYHLGTRFYAAFCIQILTYPDGWDPSTGNTGANPVWRVVPRTIRFVSEKNLPNAGHTRAEDADDSLHIFKNTTPQGFTPSEGPNPFRWLNYHAARESWIDIAIRTVIRKEDLLASGMLASPETGPLLGVRVAVGGWAVWPGPIQPNSYENTGSPMPRFGGSGQPASASSGAFTNSPKVNIRQGNLTVFPLHAGENINEGLI